MEGRNVGTGGTDQGREVVERVAGVRLGVVGGRHGERGRGGYRLARWGSYMYWALVQFTD